MPIINGALGENLLSKKIHGLPFLPNMGFYDFFVINALRQGNKKFGTLK